jgi:cyclopropane-fatty-acyl-phospholipid synthase
MDRTNVLQTAHNAHEAPTTIPKTPKIIRDVLAAADIQINGPRAHDIQIHDPSLIDRVLRSWSLGLGEAYMDGHWDCEALDQCITRLLSIDLDTNIRGSARLLALLGILRTRLVNLQTVSRASEVAHRHYNIDNTLFARMLDPAMIYSCGYWENTNDLAQAQQDKLDMVCQKLDLQPGERLLDIGCGWGGLAAHAARYYGTRVVGLTISEAQQALAKKTCDGLPVEIRLQDYRSLNEPFDKIVSVGMFEHVGDKNYAEYFRITKNVLNPEGIFLLHTIGSYTTTARTDPWIDRYIFPNGKIPSATEITSALEGHWVIEDWHNFGQDYDRTLMAWHKNFTEAWPDLAKHYDQRFYRMWSYYLLGCAGYFRSRQGQLWQLVLTPRTRQTAYRSKRFQPLRASGLST